MGMCSVKQGEAENIACSKALKLHYLVLFLHAVLLNKQVPLETSGRSPYIANCELMLIFFLGLS